MFYNFNCIYILYIVHWLDNKVFNVIETKCMLPLVLLNTHTNFELNPTYESNSR